MQHGGSLACAKNPLSLMRYEYKDGNGAVLRLCQVWVYSAGHFKIEKFRFGNKIHHYFIFEADGPPLHGAELWLACKGRKKKPKASNKMLSSLD